MTVEQRTVVVTDPHVGDQEFVVRVGEPDDGPADGPVVLLLHGFPTSGACFDAVVPRLHDSGLRTVVPDQRGYSPGARPVDLEAYRVDRLVADALGVLDALDVHYAILVGHDWGALVAWQLAARHTQRFMAFVAASVGHPSAIAAALKDSDDQRTRSSYIPHLIDPSAEDRLLADDGAALRSLVPDDSVAPVLERSGLTGALNWYRANFAGDIATTMACPPVEIPTTVVWSDADTALGREQAVGSGRFAYSDFRFTELTGVDHWIPQRAAPALASEIALRSAML